MSRPIKIIDLFAGPGGLGEGFSAFTTPAGDRPFRIAASIEKETSAHKTLLLRAFYRQFDPGEAPKEYYEFLAGRLGQDPEASLYRIPAYAQQVENARREARQLELGKDNRSINLVIEEALGERRGPWILIGGPPCQAYSLVGRVRNQGIENYKAENDPRHFLYKEYLKVIARFQPAVFVMENVKGLLSAKVDGNRIFERILSDLECPYRATRSGDRRARYRLVPLIRDESSDSLFENVVNPREFVIRAERYGIPQARHRVILIGIRDDLLLQLRFRWLVAAAAPNVKDVIGDLPRLRSGLSKEKDSFDSWVNSIRKHASRSISHVRQSGQDDVADRMSNIAEEIGAHILERGSNWNITSTTLNLRLPRQLRQWYLDKSGWRGVCNHETRGHISEDLQRYLFCACYGTVDRNGTYQSPGSAEFPDALAPDHANWKTGKFADRYRVQIANRFATTITSHISRDGHYFIHYDPSQCRSLTVREAARIQTFPDNYFFVGSRTEQYTQVGNAVPPYLAHQIADMIFGILS